MIAVYLLVFWALHYGRTGGTDFRHEIPDFRREIANKVQELTRKIQYETKMINTTILQELNKIVSLLDPQYALGTVSLLGNASFNPATSEKDIFDTKCILPWHRKGFVELSLCKQEDKQSIVKSITILLLDREEDINKISDILQTIYSYNPDIKVILGSSASRNSVKTIIAKYKNLHILLCHNRDLQRPGKILNKMKAKIRTPYVLVARDIFYFDDLSQLERQVFVIASTKIVGIAGGAFRNETGYWKVGCYFSQIKNYFLQYAEGYSYSAFDCMLCDHLEGPFVAKTSIIQSIPFDESLYEEVLFEDWFLRVKQKNILIMNCPDVMYFKRGLLEGVTKNIKSRERSSWLAFAKQWQVDQVHFPFRVSIKFTCKELRFSCDALKWAKAFLIPTCCMEQLNRALEALKILRAKEGIDYEMESGSLLGAVKLRNFLPWDRDLDFTILKRDYPIFIKNMHFFKNRGFDAKPSKFLKYHYIFSPEIKVDFFAREKTSTFLLPKHMWKYPTQVKFNGIWLLGEWNPGLWVRNMYGPGVLKHAQYNMKIDSPHDDWGIFTPGSWQTCPNKSHACLNLYPADGSEGLLPTPIAL